MKKVNIAISVIILIIFPLFLVCSENEKISNEMQEITGKETPREAANAAIEALQKLTNEENFQNLGFNSLKEVKELEVGDPIPLKGIAYNKLLNFEEGSPINTLFEKNKQFVFPLLFNEQVKTTVTVIKTDQGWVFNNFGGTIYTEIITNKRIFSGWPDTLDVNIEDMNIISIPGLNIEMVGFNINNDWWLIPTFDNPKIKVKQYSKLPAKELMPVIKSYAIEFENEYGDQIKEKRLVK